VNCHSFANHDPRDFTFHARGKNGGTIVIRDGKMKKVDIKAMSNGRHGSYNIWHPSKRYIAFSSNATHQSFYGQSKDKIEVYDLWSDLIVYDIDSETVLQDERFTDSLNLEMFPSFSPDGKWLYFSTAHPVKMPMEVEQLHYSIVRVPFDAETGKLGAVDTVYSSYELGGTAMLPRISMDGRYMLFSHSNCGAFNLYHNESDLWMMDLETRKLIPTDVLNSNRAESFHAWSSNGKWMVYMTKRFDGRYTRLMLAHWDGKKFHKPFLLPQQNPEDNTLLMMAYNVPEFITAPVIISKDDLAELFTK
jgi:Tol biopolymer transport system component